MISLERKKIAIIMLVLTVALLLITGLVAFSVSKRDSGTSVAGNNCCGDNRVCHTQAEWEAGYYACVRGECPSCSGGGPVCGNGQCQGGENNQNCPADCPPSGGGGAASGSGAGGGGGSTNTCSGANNNNNCQRIGQTVPIAGGSCTCLRTSGSACACVATNTCTAQAGGNCKASCNNNEEVSGAGCFGAPTGMQTCCVRRAPTGSSCVQAGQAISGGRSCCPGTFRCSDNVCRSACVNTGGSNAGGSSTGGTTTTGGGGTAGRCSNALPTAQSCRGQAYNSLPSGANCRCIHQGDNICACLRQDGQPAPAGGTAGLGEACTNNASCGYSGSYKLSCLTCANGRRACGNPNLPLGACESPAQSRIIPQCNPPAGGALEYSVSCDGCGAGAGRVCRSTGWSGCVRADACGYNGGDPCTGTGQGSCPLGFTCSNSNDGRVCRRSQQTNTGSIFIGCGDRVAGGNGDACSNCYSRNGNVSCFREQTSCGANVNCIGTGGGSSNTSSSSSSSSSTSSSGTSVTGTGSTSVEAPPFCGDGVCQSGELCERAGTNTYRICTTVGQAPGGDVVSECRNIASSAPSAPGACTYCGDGVVNGGEQCDYNAPGAQNCNLQCQNVTPVCLSLTTPSSTTIRAGEGNIMEYTLVYRNTAATNPYPNIRLRVTGPDPSTSVAGRDANNAASTLVAVYTPSVRNAQNSTWTYRFRWEAATTAGVAIANGDYDVRILTDGTDNSVVGTASCQQSLTADSDAPEEPAFSIIKTSSPVCLENGGVRIDYTVTVTNIGPVTGIIDQVTDELDERFVNAGIAPADIEPNYGSYSNGVITWIGSEEEREFNSGESRDYTYSITIPVNNLLAFIFTGVDNAATVQYDTDTTENNTDTFELNTPIECDVPSIIVPIPETGLFDDNGRYILIALILITGGLIVYRLRLTEEYTLNFIEKIRGSKFKETFEKDTLKDLKSKNK